MRGKNPKVTHTKDQTESQIESPENGNTECHDKRPFYHTIIFLELTKFKTCAENKLNLVKSLLLPNK